MKETKETKMLELIVADARMKFFISVKYGVNMEEYRDRYVKAVDDFYKVKYKRG